MKTKTLRLLAFMGLMSILGACNKSDTQPQPPPQGKRVSKITTTPTDFRTFQYDAGGNITRYYTQWDNGGGGITQLEMLMQYSNSKLVKSTYGSGYANYVYQNGILKSVENFTNANVKRSTWFFSFNAQGKLVAVLEQEANPRPNEPIETRTKFLYSANGNLIRAEYAIKPSAGDPFEEIYREDYVEYDGKKSGELISVLGYYIPGISFYSGNPIRINRFSASGSLEGYTRFEYEYDAAGYPVKKKQFVGFGSTELPPVIFQYNY